MKFLIFSASLILKPNSALSSSVIYFSATLGCIKKLALKTYIKVGKICNTGFNIIKYFHGDVKIAFPTPDKFINYVMRDFTLCQLRFLVICLTSELFILVQIIRVLEQVASMLGFLSHKNRSQYHNQDFAIRRKPCPKYAQYQGSSSSPLYDGIRITTVEPSNCTFFNSRNLFHLSKISSVVSFDVLLLD